MSLPTSDDANLSPDSLKGLRAEIMEMHAELSGKLRAARKALQGEQAALQKERDAHLCTLIVQEALVEEAGQYTTKEATATAKRYIQGQRDRM